MPLFLILHGYPVYINPASGPTMSTLYPPLSVLLYAPVALFHSPQMCFGMAGLISQVLWMTPLMVAFRLVKRPADHSVLHALVLLTVFELWCAVSKVLESLYLVHADDPALFLSAMGVLAFIAYSQGARRSLVVVSAVFCSLAVWAKQPAFPVVFVHAILLLVNRASRDLAIFTATVIITHLAVLAAWSQLFDLRWMFVWLIKIPASQPWKASPVVAITNASRELMAQNVVALGVLTIFAVWYVRKHASPDRNLMRRLSSEPWFVFAITGLVLWPTSVLGYCKVGGVQNALLYSTYFLAAALLLWTYRILGEHTRATAALSTVFMCLIIATVILFFDRSWQWVVGLPSRSSSVEAYNFDRKWPGEVFFPWYPLSVYLAEGHVYNFDLGVNDRLMAGIHLDRADYVAHLPPKMKYVAYDGEPGEWALVPIPEYNIRVTDPRLPGWMLYAEKVETGSGSH